MLTVIDVSKSANVTVNTVRHYVRIGLLTPSRGPSNGYKLFNQLDIVKVKFISQAKGLGFTLKDIGKMLNHSDKGESPCPIVRNIIQQRIRQNKVKLAELVGLQERMERALKNWQRMPDGEPDGYAICHLIDSVQKPSTVDSID